MIKRVLIIFIAISVLSAFVLTFASCDKSGKDNETTIITTNTPDSTTTQHQNPNNSQTDSIAVSINYATEEQLSNESEYIHFHDKHSMNTDWKVVVTINAQIDNFSFIEIIETEETQTVHVLFEDSSPIVANSYIFHTYINDATMNRGVSYTDNNGNVRYFGFDISMGDSSIRLIEFEL